MASEEFDTVLAHLKSLFADIPRKERPEISEIIALQRHLISIYANVGGKPPKIAASTTIKAVNDDKIQGEWVCAADSANSDARLMWVHGGAWISGKPEHYRHLAEYLSRALSAPVFLTDYPLAPEHPFPQGLNATMAMWDWFCANGPEGIGRAQSLWLAGDSAGANLVLSAILTMKSGSHRMPDAAATLGAATDLTGTGKSMASRAGLDPVLSPAAMKFIPHLYVRDDTPHDDWQVSPLFGDLSGLPPVLMHVGDREVLLDDTIRFAERAHEAGSPVSARVWPEMTHVFELFCHVLPEARQSLNAIAGFLLEPHGHPKTAQKP